MTDIWDPRENKGDGPSPVHVEEDEDRNNDCQPRYKVWPVNKERPDNPVHMSMRVLRKFWKKRDG